MIPFMHKEWLELVRTGKLLVLTIVSVALGVMNPAIAKLTPWLLETMSDALAESGMAVTAVAVDAMTSWTQFFKNVPMGLVVFVLLRSASFTGEYQAGTLIVPLTGGLRRSHVVLAKAAVSALLWSGFYWLCFAITYGYNAWYWDDPVTQHLMWCVVGWWLLGLWTVLLETAVSTAVDTGAAVLLGTGAGVLAVYIAALFPKVARFSPGALMETASLLHGMEQPQRYLPAAVVTVCMALAFPIAGIALFDRKQL